MTESSRPIRLGIVGMSRGMNFAIQGRAAGIETVAVCDTWPERLEHAAGELDATPYADFDAFIEHDMDAVALANFFHEHAPMAIRALESGRHVISECAACHTLAEGVALARAVERTGKTYMMAENYPYMVCNQEMRRLFQEGAVGDFRYGEGEYVHPDSARVRLERSAGMQHWRHWIPATYYCTHSLGPVMYITDTRPVKVNGFVVPYDEADPSQTAYVRRNDTAAAILLRMDNGAVVKSLHGCLRGHQNFVRIHGNKGLMENCREGDTDRLRVHLAPHGKEQADTSERIYRPEFPTGTHHAAAAGHGGSDFFTLHHFAEAVRTGRPPYLDVYRSIDMSIVGILAWRSALSDSAPATIPDFRIEEVRKRHENDHWSPDPARAEPGQPPPSILGHIQPSTEAVDFSTEVWNALDYRGS